MGGRGRGHHRGRGARYRERRDERGAQDPHHPAQPQVGAPSRPGPARDDQSEARPPRDVAPGRQGTSQDGATAHHGLPQDGATARQVPLRDDRELKGRGRVKQTTEVKMGTRGRGSDGQSKPSRPGEVPPTEAMGQMRIQPRGRPRRADDSDTHTRPDHIKDKTGSSGRPLDVVANYCMLRSAPGHSIFQYNVSYKPAIESKSLRVALLYSHVETLKLQVRVFDGMILYLPHRLEKDVTEVTSKTKDDVFVQITIKLTSMVSANSPTCLQLLNILFRRVLQRLGMQQIGRHYYSDKNTTAIPQHRMELWPGFITSILEYEQSLMLCLDVSHKVLRTDTVLDYLYDLQRNKGRSFYDIAMKQLVGEIVMTRYNNKTYRVDDIDWNQTPRATFKTSTGETKTLVEYYRESHSLQIRDMDQPLIVSRPRRRDKLREASTGEVQGPILLLPEYCTRTGLSEDARSDFHVMKDVATYTRQNPQQRLDTMNKFIHQLHSVKEVKQLLSDWNVAFSERLQSCRARVLPPQKIFMKSDHMLVSAADADWSRDMRNKHVISTNPIRHFHVFYPRGHKDSRDAADAFAGAIGRVSSNMGIRLANPSVNEIPNDRTETYIRAIQNAVSQNTQLVVMILPNNRKDRYDAIKKLCIVDHAVPSQCILSRTLKKANAVMSVTTKVALQLNCKLGGELWAVEFPPQAKTSMVIGIDTYHDSMHKGSSVAGFVSTTSPFFTRYYSQSTFQSPGQEVADNLKACTRHAVDQWYKMNNKLPERVFVYRDGVGDGQLGMVVDYEVAQIKAGFQHFGPDYRPYLAVIVVKKRINTRLYKPPDNPRGPMTNPPPGTVVDTVITRPMWYDFFLCSQSVRQGTVTPTHFNVVVDRSNLTPDNIQQFTYKLCHMYYNWPGTVRVPAPCQYAHKLAYLLGQSIHVSPKDENLRNCLYFL